jgi:hypothetical protein
MYVVYFYVKKITKKIDINCLCVKTQFRPVITVIHDSFFSTLMRFLPEGVQI